MTKPTEHPVTDPLATVEPGSASSEGTPERYVGVAGGEPELIGQGGMGRVVAVYDTHLGREVARKELASCAPLDGGTLAEHSDHPSLEELMAGGHIAESHLRICAACRVEIRLFRDAFGEVEPGSTGGVEASEEASAGPPSLAERFLLEARVTARLEHPSIIPVYELGRRPDGTLYYTMKRVRGRTLGQALDSCGDLTERLALLGHFVDLCQGVAYAHDKGVIHRDLKPQNVMLGEFGETVLLDWGLARELGGPDHGRTEPSPGLSAVGLSGGGRTMDGSVLGTLQYMSPEQARGEVEYMDARSDIWSLGAVL